MDDRWRNVQEIAEYLGVSADSVYRWVEERGLPVHRVGRLFRFKCSEIDEWVHRQDVQGDDDDAGNRQERQKKRHKPTSASR